MEITTENNENESNDDFGNFREDRNEDIFGMEEENYGTEDIEEDYDFREDDDDNNDSSESDNDDNVEEDSIIDVSMDINQMPNINNGAPYFETSTSALLFCWVQKHNICKFDFIVTNYLMIQFKI
jgi:hypothetical protein